MVTKNKIDRDIVIGLLVLFVIMTILSSSLYIVTSFMTEVFVWKLMYPMEPTQNSKGYWILGLVMAIIGWIIFEFFREADACDYKEYGTRPRNLRVIGTVIESIVVISSILILVKAYRCLPSVGQNDPIDIMKSGIERQLWIGVTSLWGCFVGNCAGFISEF